MSKINLSALLLLLIFIFFGCKTEEKPVGNNPAYGKIKITVAKNVVPVLLPVAMLRLKKELFALY